MVHLTVDILGTIAFAVSGVLVAMEKKLDLFGVIIIAFVTAIGGGTLRDLLIGNLPVAWMTSYLYIGVVLATTFLAILFFNHLKYLRKSLFLFDTLGLGLYTLVGIEKGIEADLLPVVCITLGTITASFGGVARDILCNEIPVLFRKEIYATACILGGISYFLLLTSYIPDTYAYVIAIFVVILVRLLSVRFKIGLPNIYRNKN